MIRRSRRLVSAFAALCIAWASLGPLASAARSTVSLPPMPICHQGGGGVPLRMPVQDGAPGGETKVHCPLCIMAFHAAFEPPPVAPPAPNAAFGIAPPRHCAPVPAGLEVPLPESRAPPPSFHA